MWECHSDGRNLTKWLNLLSIFLDFYELKRNWGSKTNIQQKKISQYPALLISHLLITHIYLIYIPSSNRVERLATVKVDPSHWKSICKTLRKYSASNYQGSLKMLSNPTTRHSWCRTVILPVCRFVNDRGQIVAVSRFKNVEGSCCHFLFSCYSFSYHCSRPSTSGMLTHDSSFVIPCYSFSHIAYHFRCVNSVSIRQRPNCNGLSVLDMYDRSQHALKPEQQNETTETTKTKQPKPPKRNKRNQQNDQSETIVMKRT